MAEDKDVSARRIVITIEPSDTHEGQLRVDDAMQQILDFLRVAEDAKAHLGWSNFDFEWRLESASTNSPLTITAVAAPTNSGIGLASIIGHVDEVERIAVGAFRQVAAGLPPPAWLTPDGAASLTQIHRRTLNGVSRTKYDFGGELGEVRVTPDEAVTAVATLERSSPLMAQEQFPPRIVHGEIEGRMVSVARWRNQPAIQITNTQYGLIWCVLSDQLMEQFGGEQTLSDVWRGKRVRVPGRIYYGQNGKPTRVEASAVHERDVPEINIEDLLDRDFTNGLSPVDYLDKLHEGKLG